MELEGGKEWEKGTYHEIMFLFGTLEKPPVNGLRIEGYHHFSSVTT